MQPFTLQWAAAKLNARLIGADATVTAVCTDTRKITPGALFFALTGEQTDGHRYVGHALRKGAIGAVVSEEIESADGPLLLVPDTLRALGDLAMHYRRQFDIPVVGITGSVGKTSTKEMAAAMLRTRYRTLASEKNYNSEIGVPLTLFQLDSAHEVAVIEMGMRGLSQIDRLAEIAEPTIGVITNIGYAHIELLGSQQNIARAKSELFARLPENSIAILPVQPGSNFGRQAQTDNPDHLAIDQQELPVGSECSDTRTPECPTPDACIFTPVPQAELLTYLRSRAIKTLHFLLSGHSMTAAGDVSMQATQNFPDGGIAGLALVAGQEYPFALYAAGSHNLANAELALAVAYALHVPIPDALRALSEWQGAPGRMVVRKTARGITILDDCYNASPESMVAALTTLGQASGRNKVAVLGDMKELGDYAVSAHHLVASSVAELDLRLLVTVGPLAAEIAGTVHNIASSHHSTLPEFKHYDDSQTAAAALPALLHEGDTVLVKGARAMEMEKIVAALTGEPEMGSHG